jgi:fucose 4-O-acetylase-like acetyltransferase
MLKFNCLFTETISIIVSEFYQMKITFKFYPINIDFWPLTSTFVHPQALYRNFLRRISGKTSTKIPFDLKVGMAF